MTTDNPFTLTFTLKQHTPLIHFQHEQAGATLRATEVKPKLDKFITNHFKRLFPNDENLFQKISLFSPDKKGFLYKMKIAGDGEPTKYLIASYLKPDFQKLLKENGIKFLHSMPYFAQEKEINDLFKEVGEYYNNDKRRKTYEFIPEKLADISKYGLIYDNPIKGNLFSFDKEALEILGKTLPYFFAYENFGTRQSKGFGCFSVLEPLTQEPMENIWKKLYPVIYKKYSAGDLQIQLSTIQKDYKLLKSGRSAKEGSYAKSQMFLYGVSLRSPIRWEKRKLKLAINDNPFTDRNRNRIELKTNDGNSAIYDDAGRQSWNDPNPPYHYAYIRALLGLAEQFEFQTKRWDIKYVVQIKSKNGIERFRSPITFKVWNNTIYLLAQPVPKSMLNEAFEFHLRLKLHNKMNDRRNYMRNNLIPPLRTPNNFDMSAFLKFALETGRERISGYSPI
jgi:hypothetical protein